MVLKFSYSRRITSCTGKQRNTLLKRTFCISDLTNGKVTTKCKKIHESEIMVKEKVWKGLIYSLLCLPTVQGNN